MGDARRNEVWLGRFCCADGLPEQEGPWAVVPIDRVPPDYAPSDAVWVTADWQRIGGRFKAVYPEGRRLGEERRIPEARDVGLLVEARLAAGHASLPLTPLYLHPAVFVQPREAGIK